MLLLPVHRHPRPGRNQLLILARRPLRPYHLQRSRLLRIAQTPAPESLRSMAFPARSSGSLYQTPCPAPFGNLLSIEPKPALRAPQVSIPSVSPSCRSILLVPWYAPQPDPPA